MCQPAPSSLNFGFISTRFSGTDGVSLEVEKWAAILEEMGHHCFYFAGESDRASEVSYVVPEAHFSHPTIRGISDIAFSTGPLGSSDLIESVNPGLAGLSHPCFARYIRPPATTERVQEIRVLLKQHLYKFVQQYDIDVLIVQNALSIPMNLPLGLALTDFISETGYPTIAHHHDFFWERKRFLVNCVSDYLSTAFPPNLPSIRHVVISTWAASQLSLRIGVSATVIPNVMDFENLPEHPDGYTANLWKDLGIESFDHYLLQPTRVVQRKGIEHAIELVRRLDLNACLVISHASGDEGNEYEQHIREFADLLGVQTRFVANCIRPQRGATIDGRKIFSLGDVYARADLITYPSTVEGFGNAFLEAVYYRKPIVVNSYSIYTIDIRPKGFRVVEFDGFISNDAVNEARRVIQDKGYAEEMAELNYQLASKYFSFSVLRRLLRILLAECLGE